MPTPVWLTNRATGQDEPVAPEQVASALASGKYLAPGAVAVHENGLDTYAAPDVARQDQAFTPAIDPTLAARAAGHKLRQDENTGLAATGKALVGGAVSGATAGILSPFDEAQEFNPITAGIGGIAGAVLPAVFGDEAPLLGALPSSLAARAGGAVTERLGGGVAARALGGAVEGALYGIPTGTSGLGAGLGAGAGVATGLLAKAHGGVHGRGLDTLNESSSNVAEAALPSDSPAPPAPVDPLVAEHATAALSSRALFAGEGAADAGDLEKGLIRANGALASAQDAAAVAPDLVELDAKGLRAARDAELESINANRVPQRAQLADDIAAFRAQADQDKLFLTTKGIKTDGINKLGKRTLKADAMLDRLLDNPIQLAQQPERALAALQQQDAALEGILAKEAKLRTLFAADETGTRAAALDKIPDTLARNRALQSRIAELSSAPASERLAAISHAQEQLPVAQQAAREATAAARQAERAAAAEAQASERAAAAEARTAARQAKIDAKLASVEAPPSMAEQALSGTAFGAITSAAHALPIIGQIPGAAHFLGAKGAKLLTDVVFGKLGKTAANLEARAGAAAQRFTEIGQHTGPAAVAAQRALDRSDKPPAATETLAGVSFAAPRAPAKRQPAPAETPKTLLAHYQARSDEIRSQTMYDGSGQAVLRPEARQAIGDRLAAVRAINPLLADKMETIAASRIEYLANILPRLTDMGGVRIGPERRVPSDLSIRSWARSVAAVEHPHAVLERAVRGRVVPEESAALRAVYPELLSSFTGAVAQQLPTLRATLPYNRRLALSILTGQPVDSAMQPAVIRELQAMYAREPGTIGGTQAPRAQAQFGSVQRSDPGTPAQRRAGLQ